MERERAQYTLAAREVHYGVARPISCDVAAKVVHLAAAGGAGVCQRPMGDILVGLFDAGEWVYIWGFL